MFYLEDLWFLAFWYHFVYLETLLNLSDQKDDDTSTDAGSSSGDHMIGTSGLVDPTNILVRSLLSIILYKSSWNWTYIHPIRDKSS